MRGRRERQSTSRSPFREVELGPAKRSPIATPAPGAAIRTRIFFCGCDLRLGGRCQFIDALPGQVCLVRRLAWGNDDTGPQISVGVAHCFSPMEVSNSQDMCLPLT